MLKSKKYSSKSINKGLEVVGNFVMAGLEIGCCCLCVQDLIKAIKDGEVADAIGEAVGTAITFSTACYFSNKAEQNIKEYSQIRKEE